VVTGESETTSETASYQAYRKAVAAFADAVAEGRQPSPSGLDGLRSVELTAAIAEAVSAGRVTTMEAPAAP
jgi:predicted dehydrogenase